MPRRPGGQGSAGACGDLLERVRAGGLLEPGRPVVVLLSGGRDSVCLLDLAVRIAGAPRVAALHCNYGLRAAAGQDEAHCAALCARLGVGLHVRRPLRPQAGNLQAWARERRYSEAARLAQDMDGDVAAGHTASDQVETVLYRLAASPGRRALLGMAAREGKLVRPLLAVTRAETAAHCAARALEWREDASNAAPDFARNRLRAELLPALRALHPAAEANVLRTLALLRDEAAVLDAVLDSALAEAGDPPALERLRALPAALRRLAVQRLADRSAGGRAPAVGNRAAEVLALADGGALDVGAGLRAEVRGGALRFGASLGPAAPRPDPLGRRMAAPVERDPSIGEILVQADDLRHRVRQLGAEISRDYAGRDLLLIGVLKGAVFFLADLMREIEAPCEVDFMAVASYGSATESSGVVRILKDLDTPIEGRDVLIVEDIVDSGLTLQYLLRTLEARGPASLEVCALLTKPERRTVDLPTRYVGFEIPDKFAIGYGLDHAERYRNLPYVAALSVA
jgi:tRNA(Ile)-lysidine synthase